jgi:hypothetical protein
MGQPAIKEFCRSHSPVQKENKDQDPPDLAISFLSAQFFFQMFGSRSFNHPDHLTP